MKKNTQLSSLNSQLSFWHPASLICTVFGIGKIPFAPGTWGSLAGLFPSAIMISCIEHSSNRIIFSAVILTLLFFVSTYFSNIYERKTGKKDAKEIVIDEVLGQMITIYVSYTVYYILLEFGFLDDWTVLVKLLESSYEAPYTMVFHSSAIFYLPIVTAFLTFRFFDIIKPWPVSWADKNVKGGLGVMLDDVLAAIYAGLASALILSFI